MFRNPFIVVTAAVVAWSPSVALAELKDWTLQQVVDKVRANEDMYRNLEMHIRKEYSLVRTKDRELPGFLGPDPLKSNTTRTHSVYSEGRWIHKETGDSKRIDGGPLRYDYGSSFDGKVTVAISNRDFANIHHTEVVDERLIYPNAILFRMPPGPLSAFLTPQEDDASTMWSVIGEDDVNGLRCVKLRYDKFNVESKLLWVSMTIWLAVDRNFLPVRFVEIAPMWHSELPHAEGEVTSFREVEPGVWLPEQLQKVVNSTAALREGKVVPSTRYRTFVEKAVLDPKVDKEMFRLTIPEGAFVYEVADGEIIASYRQGIVNPPRKDESLLPAGETPPDSGNEEGGSGKQEAGPHDPQRQNRWVVWLTASAIALTVAFAGIFVWRRRRLVKAATPTE